MLREIKGINKAPMKIKHKKGFTLIEVIISLAIFAILSIGIGVMIARSSTIGNQSKKKQEAQILAQELMERIKAFPSEDITSLEKYSEIGLTITKEPGKENSYLISGSSGENTIQGSIKPHDSYVIEKNQDDDIEYDLTIDISRENDTDYIIVGNNGIKKYLTSSIIDILNDESQITVKDQVVGSQKDATRKILINLGNKATGNYTVKVNNKLGHAVYIYLLKDYKAPGDLKVINDGGNVRTYTNIYSPSEESKAGSMVYIIDLDIKDSSGKSYKVSGYKSINE